MYIYIYWSIYLSVYLRVYLLNYYSPVSLSKDDQNAEPKDAKISASPAGKAAYHDMLEQQ